MHRSAFGFRDSGSRFRVAGCGFPNRRARSELSSTVEKSAPMPPGVAFRVGVSGFGFRVRVLGFRFWNPGFRVKVCDLGFRNQGLASKSWGSDFGFRV